MALLARLCFRNTKYSYNQCAILNSLPNTSTWRYKATLTDHISEDLNLTQKPRETTKHVPPNSPCSVSHPDVDLSFTNSYEAYRSKSTGELVRALFVFNMCSIELLVNNNKQILKWSRLLLGKTLFQKLMKSTFYGQFVAGEDQEDIRPLVSKNRKFGVKSILDYSVEEDLSTEKAREAEMRSCVPPEEDPHLQQRDSDPEVQKFKPHEEFGDRREGVFSARTYFYEDEAKCDDNMNIFLDCIDAVAGAVTDDTGFIAIKMTALGRPQFLLQLSEVLVSSRKLFNKFAGSKMKFSERDFEGKLKRLGINVPKDDRKRWFGLLDVTKDGEVDLLDWDSLLDLNMSMGKMFAIPNEKTGELEPAMLSLSEVEQYQLKKMFYRLNRIAEYADKKGVRVMVDAEQTYFQPAISRLTMEMKRKFNKDHAVIFNTYQCYLKSTYDSVCHDLGLSRREDFHFGAKLVRGAYMEQERERAVSIGYEDPINSTFNSTSKMYHDALEEVMKQINERERGRIAVMVASHNEETVRFTVEKMKEYNIGPQDRLICFGQLLGMCDQVSFSLGQAGYSVYKYVPYGPVEDVLPYLSRRAMENRGILQKVKKEKKLLWEEFRRRMKKGQLRYNPV